MCQPVLRAHGFTLKHRVEPGRDGVGIVVRSTLEHAGHQEVSLLPLKLDSTGNKNDNQGVNSSITYGKRINTTTLLDIISKDPKDDDRDGNHPKARGARGTDAEQANGGLTAEQTAALIQKIET